MAQKPIRVTLTEGEWAVAAIAGLLRQLCALMRKMRPDWEDGSEYTNHVLGALGEAAWHKWRNIWWPAPLNEGNKADAEGCVQVRTTPRLRPYFKVKPRDNPDWTVVFIKGGTRTFEIVGCMEAREAQSRYATDDPGERGKPCHEVPVEDMYSVEEFARQLDEKDSPEPEPDW